jgi:hypothetical protein
MATPTFISQPQSVIVKAGDTIRLPCMVDRLEEFVMLWKKNKDIITVASQIINKVKHKKEGRKRILRMRELCQAQKLSTPKLPTSVLGCNKKRHKRLQHLWVGQRRVGGELCQPLEEVNLGDLK